MGRVSWFLEFNVPSTVTHLRTERERGRERTDTVFIRVLVVCFV